MSKLSFQSKEKTIGDCTYVVEPLGFIEGRKAFVRLANLIGPALAAFASNPQGTGEERVITSFAPVLSALLEKLSDADLEFFQMKFAAKTIVKLPDGKEPVLRDVIETHFMQARFIDFFAWIVFCIQVNYGDFFAGAWLKLKGAMPAPTKTSASHSTSIQTSNGQNGD